MDHIAALKAAASVHADGRSRLRELEAARDLAIRRAHRDGRMTSRQIAEHVGISHQRVASILGEDRVLMKRRTLHEAMRIVLRDAGGDWMPAADLAAEIDARRLYTRRDRAPIPTKQIRARLSHHRDLFEGSTDGTNRVRLR